MPIPCSGEEVTAGPGQHAGIDWHNAHVGVYQHKRIKTVHRGAALAGVDAAAAQRVYAFWDAMAGTDPSAMDTALKALLQGLCDVLDAYTANALVTVRMPAPRKTDPVQGWRPRHTVHLHVTPQVRENLAESRRRFKTDERDITVVRNVAFAGTWRANRLCELAPPEWFESDFYDQFYRRIGARDAIWVGCPINADLELYFGLFRSSQQPLFVAAEAEVALLALRALPWFLQRYVLGLGLDIATDPLTEMERRVLRQLLRGETQECIAQRMAHSQHTTHDHIKSIYRKFDVNSRATLSALWLGRDLD